MNSLEELKKYIKDLKDVSINKSKDIKSNKKKMLCEQIDFISLVLENNVENSLKTLDILNKYFNIRLIKKFDYDDENKPVYTLRVGNYKTIHGVKYIVNCVSIIITQEEFDIVKKELNNESNK